MFSAKHVDDVMVGTRGGNLGPRHGNITIGRHGQVGGVRDVVGALPFALTLLFAGEVNKVVASVGDGDFTIRAILGVAGPTSSDATFDTGGQRVVFFVEEVAVAIEIVITCTTIGEAGASLSPVGDHTNGTVLEAVHTVGCKAVDLQVVVGLHGLGIVVELRVSGAFGNSRS